MSETADGTLIIIVCRAKHLPNRRKMDKQSPYVTMRIGPTATKTPSHFRAGQTPEWTHEVRFQLTRDRKPIMKLDVLDETKDEPTPIGAVEIDCSEVFKEENKSQGKYIYDKWWDLTFNGKRAGMIYLEMTFYPSAPIIPPKIPQSSDPLAASHQQVVRAPAVDEFYPEADQNEDSYSHRFYSSTHSASHNPYNSLSPHSSKSRSPSPSKKLSVADDIFVSEPRYKSSRLSTFAGNFNDPLHEDDDPEMVKIPTKPKSHKSHHHKPHNEDHAKTGKLSKLARMFNEKRPVGTLFDTNGSSIIKRNVFNDDSDDESIDFASKSAYLPNRELPPIPKDDSGRSPPKNRLKSKFIEGAVANSQMSSEFSDFQPFINSQASYDTPVQNEDQLEDLPAPPPPPPKKGTSNKSVSRKPPPPETGFLGSLLSSVSNLNFGGFSTSLPFSADSIGADEDADGQKEELPTKVYMLDKNVQSLTQSGNGMTPDSELPADELDPKYYAPSPNEHLSKTMRLQEGRATKNDVSVDLRTRESGYLGAGKWQTSSKFSPSVFDRMPTPQEKATSKPRVPPKVPQGLSEMEYYVLEKKKFLDDLKGKRM